MIRTPRGLLRVLTTLAALFAVAGCGAAPEGDPVLTTVTGDAQAVAAAPDADMAVFDGGVLDARISLPLPQPPSHCSPGRYEGMFSCLISGLLPWQGKMSFSLVAKMSGGGEFSVLDIVPGTRIVGNDDNLNGMFEAELTGSFDCRTGVLSGALTNGNYLFAGFMNYQLEGALEGSYLEDGGVPEFQGSLGPLTSKNFEAVGAFGPSAMCTWNAAFTTDAPEDASTPDAT